jgi:tRNA/tmRNA/rRNA uracil-C5-methylase (TrmA/RlmC/RlmD family)
VLIPEIDFSTLPVESIGSGKRIEVALSSGGERTVAVMDGRAERTSQRATPTIVEGKKELIYSVNNFKYQVSQESFWQSNINAPEILVKAFLGFAELRAGDHLLDLYGGVGLFTGAALAHIGSDGRVDIVEGSAAATKDARHNFARYPQVQIHNGDVAREIMKFNEADVIVLDPPRTGAGKRVIEEIADLGARAIIYVACDPAALARDTVYLNEAGYHLEDIRAFDLFPMTHHIESIALYTPREVS